MANPVADFIGKLYMPNWTAASLSLQGAWGFEVPSGVACMVVVVSGGGWYQSSESGQNAIPLIAGDHLIVARNNGHRFMRHQSTPTEPVEHYLDQASLPAGMANHPCHTVLLYAQYETNPFSRKPIDLPLPAMIHANHHQNPDLAFCPALLELIKNTLRESPHFRHLTINKLAEIIFLQTLWIALEKEIAAASDDQTGALRLMKAATDSFVGPVLRSIADRPERSWTVPIMARIAGVSKSTFFERFRKLVGQPPLRYLTNVRMNKACRLLSEGHADISEIALQVGYESLSSFSNAFKKWCAQSPAEYRKLARTKSASGPNTSQSDSPNGMAT